MKKVKYLWPAIPYVCCARVGDDVELLPPVYNLRAFRFPPRRVPQSPRSERVLPFIRSRYAHGNVLVRLFRAGQFNDRRDVLNVTFDRCVGRLRSSFGRIDASGFYRENT